MSINTEVLQLKQKGDTAFQSNNYLDALTYYTEALKINRNNAGIWGNRAATYYNLHLYDKAVEDYSYALELSPFTIKYYLYKGAAHLQLGQLFQAQLCYQNGLEREPENALLKEAHSLRKIGEPSVVGNGRYSFGQKREKGFEFKEQGNESFHAKKYTSALKFYSQAISIFPVEPVFNTNRAACHIELQQYQAAVDYCKLAITLWKTNAVNAFGETDLLENRHFAKAYMRLATAYDKLSEHKQALEAIEQAIEYESSPLLLDMKKEFASKVR